MQLRQDNHHTFEANTQRGSRNKQENTLKREKEPNKVVQVYYEQRRQLTKNQFATITLRSTLTVIMQSKKLKNKN